MYSNPHLLPAVIESLDSLASNAVKVSDGVTIHTKQLKLKTKSALFVIKSEEFEGSVRDNKKGNYLPIDTFRGNLAVAKLAVPCHRLP